MSEETFQHTIEKEYDELVDEIGDSDMMDCDKQCLRSLLSAAYRNTNGDPPTKKIRLMAQVDWQIAVQLATSHALMTKTYNAVQDMKEDCQKHRATPEQPQTGIDKTMSFVERCKWAIAATIAAVSAFPHGPEIINALKSLWGG